MAGKPADVPMVECDGVVVTMLPDAAAVAQHDLPHWPAANRHPCVTVQRLLYRKLFERMVRTTSRA
jgi:hypothetical protein